MKFPSNRTLGKICVYTSVICVSGVLYVRSKIQDNVRHSECFREAFKVLRNHKGVVHLMGEPIKEAGFDLSDSVKNFTKDNRAQYEVKVKGPKDRGIMFFWANRNGPDDGWTVNRLELELDSQPDRRLLVVGEMPEKSQ